MMMRNELGEEDDQQIELPPGFRFHPTDEELITHYLSPKVLNNNFNAIAIGEADLNKSEPWDLPGRAKMGEKEWYFFCLKDRKYPTGLRTNRATESGYWKATGKDREIFRGKRIVGMKKTLVFYTGRAPKGEKSNWVMHEYRLQPKFPLSAPHHLLKPTKNEWVICRIFNKSSADKRTHMISQLVNRSSPGLPPLMDYSYSHQAPRAPRVTCFSNNNTPIHETKPYSATTPHMVYNFKTHHFSSSSSTNPLPPPPPTPPSNPADDPLWVPIARMLLENQTASGGLMNIPKLEISQYTQGFSHPGIGMMNENLHNPSPASDDPIDLESLWNY